MYIHTRSNTDTNLTNVSVNTIDSCHVFRAVNSQFSKKLYFEYFNVWLAIILYNRTTVRQYFRDNIEFKK